jgi:cell division protease FtsH
LPEKDSLSYSKTQAENWIAFAFGGRAAEELIFKDFTTGAANDIERATSMARRMVCEWGMSPLGPLAFEKNEGPVFLGMGYGQKAKEYSEAKAQEIDKEISKIINTGYERAMKILVDHKEALEKITQALLEFETIDANEVEMLVNGAQISEITKVRSNKSNSGGGRGGAVTTAETSTATEDVAPHGRKPASAT